MGGHGVAPFESAKMRVDSPQSGFVLGEAMFELRATQSQHAAELLEGRVVIEDNLHLVEGEAEVA